MGGETIIVCYQIDPLEKDPSDMSEAVGQMCSTWKMKDNLAQVEILVQKSVKAGAKVNLVPFIVCCLCAILYHSIQTPIQMLIFS